MIRMIEKIAQLLIGCGLLLLLIAAILMALGHSPESFSTNFQAETLANYSYSLFFLGTILSLIVAGKSIKGSTGRSKE